MIPLWWCRVSVIGVLLLQPVWFGLLAPPTYLSTAFVLVLTTVPLLLVLPGVWQLKTRTLVIAGCLLLMYFSFAVMEAYAHPAVRIQALLQTALVVIYFIALPKVRQPPAESG